MAELGLLSLTEIQKLALSQQNHLLSPSFAPKAWMWNPKPAPQEPEDDSWEVRAFAEDTGNAMGTTWPPRSYTCTFCRREFRSAQALGGHMNVHRRDRARLHQSHPPMASLVSSSASASSFIIPTQEFVNANRGLCLVYQLPSPNNHHINGPSFSTTSSHHGVESSSSPSTHLSISPNHRHPHDYLVSLVPPNSSNCHSNKSGDDQEPSSSGTENGNFEEIDLELRLGHGRPTVPS